ncbi:hypothetical protein [Phycisphaera mikurensis]|uniref:Xylose isomerase-like TIM barrel domain-containing protein n=1 Tax=Phycisphaera mikurensis (strain NBRC 102666 / KCTC 22515 / FYK2301M01) TaxID=1142394 RepID=I0IGN2_PHYMF|nr:hypothetical protein [Phycisphaera mikurensis]MBB6442898.1 hypothetical protein [Phycisphaera mikurensis]BAM04420.1 hypothetical protein PSMK_22610 [Phycisphaera mikurensis NBRC 102666]
MRYVRLAGSSDQAPPPRPARFFNMGTFDGLPDTSSAPRGSEPERLAALREAGFEGVQGADADAARDAGLHSAASGRLDTPAEARDAVRRWKDQGHVAVTLHAGRGLESDAEADALAGAAADAEAEAGLPVYVETHRATITQDTWRTLQLLGREPRLGLNADLSHWYTGLEMPYAGVERVADFLAPTFERVGFLHGRIGSSGSMQVDAGNDLAHALTLEHVRHFVLLWTRAAAAFRANAEPGDVLPFAPELLGSQHHYARVFPAGDGQLREETDRWQQALLLCELFEHAFEAAG